MYFMAELSSDHLTRRRPEIDRAGSVESAGVRPAFPAGHGVEGGGAAVGNGLLGASQHDRVVAERGTRAFRWFTSVHAAEILASGLEAELAAPIDGSDRPPDRELPDNAAHAGQGRRIHGADGLDDFASDPALVRFQDVQAKNAGLVTRPS